MTSVPFLLGKDQLQVLPRQENVCSRSVQVGNADFRCQGLVITTVGAWGYRKGWQEWREDHEQVGRPASEDANRVDELSAGTLKTLDMMGRVERGW